MEAQEEVMQRRFVDLATSMTKVATSAADRFKKYQRQKLQQYYEYVFKDLD